MSENTYYMMIDRENDSILVIVKNPEYPELAVKMNVIVDQVVMNGIRTAINSCDDKVKERIERKRMTDMMNNRHQYEGGLELVSDLPGALSIDDLCSVNKGK